MSRLIFALILLYGTLAVAQQPQGLEPVPGGVPEVGEASEAPEVTIRRREGSIVEEYRLNGRLYMVRVVPERGLPYFLIDTDGDGQLDTRRNQFDAGLMVPGWVLFEW